VSNLVNEFEMSSVYNLIYVVAVFSVYQNCINFKQISVSAIIIKTMMKTFITV